VTATTNGQTEEEVFTVTVTAIDDAPAVTNMIADLTVPENAVDTVIDLSNVFNDPDDDNASITKTAVSSNASLLVASLTGDTLTLDYQANQFGTTTITVTANSNGQTVKEVFTVTVSEVDDPPTAVNEIVDFAVLVNSADTVIDLSNVFNDPDDDNASITKTAISSAPSLATAVVSGNTLTIDYQTGQSGTATVTVTATSNGQTVNEVFSVLVTPPNNPPVVANSIGDVTVNEDNPNTMIDLSNVFNDSDNDNASITKAAISSNVSLVTAVVSGNTLSLDYLANMYGTATITVTATSNVQTVNDVFVVTVNGVNDPPMVIHALGDVTAQEDATDTIFDLSNIFNDIDDDNASITKAAVSSDVSLVTAVVSGNTLTLNYQQDRTGTAMVTVTATSNGQTVDENLTVTVTPIDDAPIVSNGIGDIMVSEDAPNTTIDFSNVFNDVDDDNASISKTVASSNVTLVTAAMNGNILTLDYQANQHGTATITVTANSNGKTVNEVFGVTVVAVNDPPEIINEIADILVQENSPNMVIDLSNVFNDPDDDNASIVKSAVSSDVSLVTTSVTGNTLTLDYKDNRVGTAIITVSATSNGQTVHDYVTVTVTNDRFLNVYASPGGTANGSGTYEYNAVAAITATPDTGFEFMGWSGTGIADSNSMSTTVSMTENRNVSAIFKAITYPLSVTAEFGGAVTGSGVYAHGIDANVSANPIPSHHFTGWSGSGISNPNSSVTTVTMTEPRNVTANFALNRYELNVSAETGGHVIGSGTFGHGTIATIAASPKTGYDFSGWSGLGTSDSNSSYALVFMTKDYNVTANFQLKTYPLTVISETGGAASGSGTFEHGDEANVTATSSIGQHFTGWSGTGISNATKANTTVSMTKARNVTAYFAINRYNLNVFSEPGGSAIGSGTFEHGTQPTITAGAETGYSFAGWTVGATDVNAITTTVNMTQDRNVSATFATNQHLLTISTGTGGNATGSGTYDYNSNVNISAIPDTGYDFAGWTGAGVNDPHASNSSVYLTHDRNVSATFVLKTHALTVIAGTGGSTSGSGSFLYGTEANVTATPAVGHDFINWIGLGVSDPNSSETTVSITHDQNISAIFIPKQFPLKVSSSSGGSAFGDGNYSYGTNPIITAIPDSGYYFAGWDGNNLVAPSSPSTTVSILSDGNVTANFALIPANQHVLQTFANPVGSGSTTGGGTFNNGTTTNITAIPTDGYIFSHWSGSGITNLNSSATTVTVSADLTVTAHFELGLYLLLLTPDQGGSVIGNGSFTHGENPSITATPATGYDFVKWVGEGVASSTSASTTVHMNNNRSISAVFAPSQHILTLTAGSGGSVIGEGTYLYGTNTEITATASEGYLFSGWNGTGIADLNSYTTNVLMNSDHNATANFALAYYVLAVEADPSNGGTVIGGGIYTHGQTVNIATSPAAGYRFSGWTSGSPVDSNSSSTTVTVTGSVTLKAKFEKILYNVNATVTPAAAGSVSGIGSYEQGETITLTANPIKGYEFSLWSGATLESPTSPSQSITVTSDVNIAATFERHPSAGTLAYALDAEHLDNFWRHSSWFGYFHQTTEHWNYHMDFGWIFTQSENDSSLWFWTQHLGWLWTNKDIYPHVWRHDTQNWNYFTRLSDNTFVSYDYTTSSWEKITARYEVKVISFPSDGGSASGGGIYEEGTVLEIQANPVNGYRFKRWLGNASGTTSTLSVTAIRTLIIYAEFEKNTP
jgi:uncharacterized repeat protein (TIGR02543 family)